MKPQLSERLVKLSCLAEFDPSPRYIVATLRSNWVRGSNRRRWRLVREAATIYVAVASVNRLLIEESEDKSNAI
jgi:hypothetical protein